MASSGYGGVLRDGVDRLTRLDASMLVAARRLHSPRMNRLATYATRLGDPKSWVVHGAVLWVAGGQRLGVLLAGGGLLALGASQLLKRMCRRARPRQSISDWTTLLDDPDAFSFPSGHAAVAFGVATALATGDSRIAAAEIAFASAIGFSRIYLGAHYPADVLAGALLGVLCGALASFGCALAGI
jgi:undecaprenyl-diphosphatase